jgi:peroxiredoxin
VDQLGKLAQSAAALRQRAEVYVVNPDTPENAKKVRKMTGLTIPLLLDPGYTVASRFDLRGADRPMGGLVGYVIIDAEGTIRVQRVDIDFGSHAGQILNIVRSLPRKGQ